MSTSLLATIPYQLNHYGYPLFLFFGTIGNLLVVILFSRQRQNACSLYLLSSAIMNDLYLTFNSFIQIFPFDYGDETPRAFALCKIRFYVSNVLGQLAKTMIVLACIDRFLITSNHATCRALSTVKRAKGFIFLSILFWPLFASHIAIMTTIINKQCGTFNTYSTIYTIYTIIFVALIPPILLGICGYLTYRHMKHIHVRIQPAINHVNEANSIPIQRRDRELLIIVISEVFIYVLTTTLYPLVLLEMMISRYIISNKSVQYSQIENLIFTISFLLLFVNNTAPFYIYLLSSKSFRRDCKELMINSYRKVRNRPPITGVRRTNPVLFPQHAHICLNK